jgi:hypothetical protein
LNWGRMGQPRIPDGDVTSLCATSSYTKDTGVLGAALANLSKID